MPSEREPEVLTRTTFKVPKDEYRALVARCAYYHELYRQATRAEQEATKKLEAQEAILKDLKDKFEAQEAILDDLRSEYQEVDLNLEDMRDQFAAKEKECEKLKDQLGKWMRRCEDGQLALQGKAWPRREGGSKQ